MQSPDFDIIIIGSGPAGVSAAFPLVEAGLDVLMVDGGREPQIAPPSAPYLTERASDPDQWKWMVGEDFHALRQREAASPKLRSPIHRPVFEDFLEKNRVAAEEFRAVGSLARGGLSTAWGCGVARFDEEDLKSFPFVPQDIEGSYRKVGERIGISGGANDDLSAYFGLDELSMPAVEMDEVQGRLLHRYYRKAKRSTANIRMGRARIAALTRDHNGRSACDYTGNCLWGCARGSLYSAAYDIASLQLRNTFHYRPGHIATAIRQDSEAASISTVDAQNRTQSFSARKVLLAAGTLASTRLALQAVDGPKQTALESCPTAAFLLWLPEFTGRAWTDGFGLGQTAFTFDHESGHSACGSLFTPIGIPLSEFIGFMPLRRRFGTDILSHIMSSCVVGNLFWPGALGTAQLSLTSDGSLRIAPGTNAGMDDMSRAAKRALRTAFGKLGAFLLPFSFTRGAPGSDIHYACSLPMRTEPGPGETDRNGKLHGSENIHVVDGASLSSLPEKPHTLTIMANADRIGTEIVKELTTEKSSRAR